jgi:hypothetical protein
MANGVAVALRPELDPSSLPDATELEIGDAVAAAAMMISGGVGEFMTFGQLSAEAKLAGAEALTKISMLQLAFFGNDADFVEVALREGQRALWRHHGFREHIAASLDPATREHMFEVFLQGALEIAGRSVAAERALQAH